MSPALIAAALRLADVLTAENAALAALDLPRAAALLEEKTLATDGFLAARAQSGLTADEHTIALAGRLCALADKNRRLLEHALRVQRRVMGVIARAAPKPPVTARYGRNGRPDRARGPVAVLSRA